MSGIMSVIGMIPLANAGFAWLVPTIIGFFAGSIYWKAAGKDSLPYANEE